LPATQQLLTAALAHSDSTVRRVAARVARSTSSVTQIAALERALATEPADTLTRTEIESALAALRGQRPDAEAPTPANAWWIDPPKPGAPKPAARKNPSVRLWPSPSPTLARDLLRATGCKLPKNEHFMIAQVDYRPNGSIQRGALEGDGLSAECRRLGAVMTALTVASSGQSIEAGVKEVVVLAFDPDYLACVEGTVKPGKAPPERRPVPIRGSVDGYGPRKTRHVDPAYPKFAQDQLIQGLVILAAVITADGCPSGLEVVRGVHPVLDYSALRTVMKWRYAPATMNGEAIPVFMTVAVNFALTK
jgi:TonB family protein